MFSGTVVPKVQKQPPEVFCKKRCSKKFRNIHRKIPVLESLFDKVAVGQVCDFILKKVSNTSVFL